MSENSAPAGGGQPQRPAEPGPPGDHWVQDLVIAVTYTAVKESVVMSVVVDQPPR